jgi:hypothetical protein
MTMKKVSLTFFLICCTLMMAAQDSAIKVNYRGATPTISDFVWAYLCEIVKDGDDVDCYNESEGAFKNAWLRHRKGQPQNEGCTLTIDEKNGYVCYESRYEEHLLKVEACYWNEADKKHKLFAYSHWCFSNGRPSQGQYDTLVFSRYNNATKKMTMCDTPGFDVDYYKTTYVLPRTGKDIIATKWNDDGTKTQKTLKWNGRGFSK